MCGFVGWLGRWLDEERYMREKERERDSVGGMISDYWYLKSLLGEKVLEPPSYKEYSG